MFQKTTLYIPCTILVIIATVQLALVSRMVAFLHIQETEIGTYYILNTNTSPTDSNGFYLHVLPEKILHKSGTCHQWRSQIWRCNEYCIPGGMCISPEGCVSPAPQIILLAITIAISLLVLFILTALTYVLAVTYLIIDNKIDIDIDVARTLSPTGPQVVAYSIDSWMPETWYQALLLLPLDASTESGLSAAVSEMAAWRAWITLYEIVAMVVTWWTGMAYLREWKRVCGCSLGSGTGTRLADLGF